MATKQHEPYTTQLSPDQPSPDEEKSHNAKDTKQYKLPTWRKCIILFVVSWMTLAVTFSSTSFLPATPEIAAEFGTTTEILNATNAGVLLAMGFSSLIWGPVGNLIGRKYAYNIAIFVLCGCSAGAAAAINMRMFTTMRILAGLTGTSFMVSGQTIIADIFEPVLLPPPRSYSCLLGLNADLLLGCSGDGRGLLHGWKCGRACYWYVDDSISSLY